ncbi:MAG TPA: hypothetical protein VGV61_10915 [Thermoanaerobaculia bacterium]|jgi:O-antigen/teichoic acid export membrane protein|nr:hypothetical protein [Thermoanaerobaculia bacterium]
MVRGGLLFGMARLGGLALSLAATALLVRLASPADVGSYLLLLQAASGVGLAFQLGLVPAVLRFAPLARGAGGKVATAVLRRRLLLLQLAAWGAFLPLLLGLWPALARRLGAAELGTAGLLVAGFAALLALQQLANGYLRAFQRYATAAALDSLVPRLLLVAALVALWWGSRAPLPWGALAAAALLVQVLSAVAGVVALRSTTGGEEGPSRTATPAPPLPVLAEVAATLGVRGMLALFLYSADLWVLSAVRPHEDVATYGVMLRLVHLVAVVPALATLVVPQELSLLHAAGRRAEVERLARSTATLSTVAAASTALVLLLAGRPLLRLAFGPAYAAGWGYLLLLCAGRVIDAAAGPAAMLLQMTGEHRRLLASTALGGAITVGGGLLLGRAWGAYGVAGGATLGLLAFDLANVRNAWRRLGVRTYVSLR